MSNSGCTAHASCCAGTWGTRDLAAAIERGVPETVAQVAAYLDGDLDAAACAAIERHADACPVCARFVRGLQETMRLCHEAGTRPLPDDLLARARARLARLVAVDDEST